MSFHRLLLGLAVLDGLHLIREPAGRRLHRIHLLRQALNFILELLVPPEQLLELRLAGSILEQVQSDLR